MRQRLAPPRFGDQVTEAGNTGRRAALSFGKADSEIGHRRVVGGGVVNETFLGKAMVVLGRVQVRMWARGAELGFVVCAGA